MEVVVRGLGEEDAGGDHGRQAEGRGKREARLQAELRGGAAVRPQFHEEARPALHRGRHFARRERAQEALARAEQVKLARIERRGEGGFQLEGGVAVPRAEQLAEQAVARLAARQQRGAVARVAGPRRPLAREAAQLARGVLALAGVHRGGLGEGGQQGRRQRGLAPLAGAGEFGAEHAVQTLAGAGLLEGHGGVEAVGVGEGQGGEAPAPGQGGDRLGLHRASQQRVGAVDVQMHEGHARHERRGRSGEGSGGGQRKAPGSRAAGRGRVSTV